MVSTPDHRKSLRFEHKSTVMLSEGQSAYFSYAKMFNFSGGGLHFKSDKWQETPLSGTKQ